MGRALLPLQPVPGLPPFWTPWVLAMFVCVLGCVGLTVCLAGYAIALRMLGG